MFEISVDAIIFYLGTFGVRWYLIMEILALVAVITIVFIEGRRLGAPLKHMYVMFLLILIAGLILAKATDIIGRPAVYAENPDRIYSLGGMRVGGIFFGALLVKLLYCWAVGLSFWKVSDIFAPGTALGSALMRMGCCINGCCYGMECPIPWLAVTYTGAHSLAPFSIGLYPVQFYGILSGLIIFIVLWSLRKKLQPEGSIFLLFYILYAALDFVIRLFRQPDAVIAGVQIQQIINVIMLMVAIQLFIIRRRRLLTLKT